MGLDKKVDELKDDLIESVKRVVKIKSVQGESKAGMPFGEGPRRVLDCALDISKKLGFKTVNMDGYIGYAEYGQGDDYVAILGHLDVVPEGDGWKYPPFAAEIHDGKMYGRGTMDDKGPTMAALYGLKAIKDLNLPLSKRVRVIFGTNEETGSKEVKYYMDKEKAPVLGFTPDAEYPIIYAEKGITIFDVVKDLKAGCKKGYSVKSIKGGTAPNAVPAYCECIIGGGSTEDLKKLSVEFSNKTGFDIRVEADKEGTVIKAYGLAAHGSLPELGKNAVMRMFAFLDTLPLDNPELKDYIHFFNKYVGEETDGESFGVYLEDKESGRVTFNVGCVEMKDNSIKLSLNIRYPVTYTFDDLMNPFNKKLEGTGIKVKNMMHQKPLYFHANHPLIKALQKVYEEQTGKKADLLAIGGGTYAKEMPNIVAFGPIFPGKPDLDHQANEYIEIEDLIANAKIYAHAIYELAK
ncbi:MAG TPA: dipeptidase PepV [Clostridiaceae bacterium]|nr:dipeptidase PepV [Clostridiaceae bacterium]